MWCTVSPLARYCDWVAAHAEHEADVGDIIDQICDEQDTEWRSCYGIGVLLVQSSINHACEPNTTLTFDSAHASATITLQSRQQIEVGQEITISYIEPGECYKTRQLELSQQYLFDCECDLCIHENSVMQ